MINIIGKRFWFFSISGVLILIGVISLIVFGLKAGIEFSSGSVMTVHFEQNVEQTDLKQELSSLGYTSAIVQRVGEGGFLIRTYELTDAEKAALESALATRFGKLTESEFSSVSPIVATETAHNAGIAVLVAAIGILFYITWAFRKMPKPFRYGTCAVIALVHDVLISVGMFSILGGIFGWEMNLMFITGILTVIGYSINNTVVVFDRIRENLRMGVSHNLEVIVNNSLIETMGRSLNTSLTTLFVALSLIFFVGAAIQNFAAVFVVGIVAGAFSSVCIAPPLLVVWENKEWGRFISWLPVKAKT